MPGVWLTNTYSIDNAQAEIEAIKLTIALTYDHRGVAIVTLGHLEALAR